jgi:uroporphyrinogen III methyltransferase/synthase
LSVAVELAARPAGTGGTPRLVVVTRPEREAQRLGSLLAARGFEPLYLPSIAIEPLVETPELDAALREVERYQWLVLPSAQAAGAFLDRLDAAGNSVVARHHLGVVCGLRTAAVLREHGIEPSLALSTFSAAAAIEALRGRLTRGERVLLPRGDLGDGALATGLRALGAVVQEAVCYRTVQGITDFHAVAAMQQALARGDVLAVTFFSPSAVRALVAVLGGSEPASRALRDVAIACIGGTTAAALTAHGLPADVVPGETSAAALVEALAAWQEESAR